MTRICRFLGPFRYAVTAVLARLVYANVELQLDVLRSNFGVTLK